MAAIFRIQPTGRARGALTQQSPGNAAAQAVVAVEFFSGIVSGALKRWSGSAWVLAKPKVYAAGSFQVKPVKIWNGAAWITLSVAP